MSEERSFYGISSKELSEMSVFDSIVESIKHHLYDNNLKIVHDNIDLYQSIMHKDNWGNWKNSRIEHGEYFKKLKSELMNNKVKELILDGKAKQVMFLDDITSKLSKLEEDLLYTCDKYRNLSLYIINYDKELIEIELYKKLGYHKFKLKTSFYEDFYEFFKSKSKSLINVSHSNETYRRAGKTSILLDLCEETGATLLVGRHYQKKELNKFLTTQNRHVKINYCGDDYLIDSNEYYYVDDSVEKEILEEIIKHNPNCLGGFVNWK